MRSYFLRFSAYRTSSVTRSLTSLSQFKSKLSFTSPRRNSCFIADDRCLNRLSHNLNERKFVKLPILSGNLVRFFPDNRKVIKPNGCSRSFTTALLVKMHPSTHHNYPRVVTNRWVRTTRPLTLRTLQSSNSWPISTDLGFRFDGLCTTWAFSFIDGHVNSRRWCGERISHFPHHRPD